MRVIAGTARSIPLLTPEGKDTRPTTDRIKETLFNILRDEIPLCTFIDVFAGSGGIGIEALSRGAKEAYFIDNGKPQIDIIRKNLEKCRLADKARVLRNEASVGIERAARFIGEGKKLIVFMDPPYDKGIELPAIRTLIESKAWNERGLIIVEMSLRADTDVLSELGLSVTREKCYKNQKHVFLRGTSRY